MGLFRKISIGLAAGTLATAPTIASAVPAIEGTRAVSASSGANELDGNNSWLIGIAAVLIGVAAIIVATDNDDDEPVSP